MLHALEAALAEDPGDLLGWLALADHLEEIGQPEKARATRAFRSALPGVDAEGNTATLDALMQAGHYPHNVLLTNSVGMTLALVPAGKFLMGSPKTEKYREGNEKQHEVEITRPFYVGIHEVTQAQYEQVMGTNPSHFAATGQNRGRDAVKGLDTHDFPVENVSWHDATGFCEKLSALEIEKSSGRVYRLPTEAEWEYACREAGLKGGPFHFGETLTSDLANFDGNQPYGTPAEGPFLARTTPVGHYRKPNALGLHDLHGNVWEWSADWYSPDFYKTGPREDPTGPTTGTHRIVRGGGWGSYGHQCRAAKRFAGPPNYRRIDFGFRVVLCLAPGLASSPGATVMAPLRDSPAE